MNAALLAKKILKKVQKDHSDPQDVSRALVSILKKYKLMNLLPAITAELENLYKNDSFEREDIVVAQPIDFDLMSEIIKKYKLSANARCVISPEILGGYQIITKDKKVDASVSEHLQQLQHHLSYHV